MVEINTKYIRKKPRKYRMTFLLRENCVENHRAYLCSASQDKAGQRETHPDVESYVAVRIALAGVMNTRVLPLLRTLDKSVAVVQAHS
jgi:hypothetical protein